MNFFLCDDDLSMHQVYEKKLSALCKKHNIPFEFYTFASGEQMLFDFEEHNALEGILFLDIHMPEIDGISIAKKLKEMNARCEIVFLTVSKEHFFQHLMLVQLIILSKMKLPI